MSAVDNVSKAVFWLNILENASDKEISLKAAIAALAYTNLALLEQQQPNVKKPEIVEEETSWLEVKNESLKERLTNRETEILLLTMEGHSNAHMARKLWVTEQTIKFHLSNIYRKLGVSNRTEASGWAHRNLEDESKVA